jgi:hypothetical protein
VISDYMTSLMQSWIANRQFFFVNPDQQAFFGTQLVLISRQFTTISETVNEVRFALDSVFIGPSERQTLLLRFADTTLAPMFLEDVLGEVEKFAGDEGPRLLRDGGKISVTNNILPVVLSLQNMIKEAHRPVNIHELPDGFKTARVRHSLDDLLDQLKALIELIEQVEQGVPPSEDKLAISGISSPQETTDDDDDDFWSFSIFGNGFAPGATVEIYSTAVLGIAAQVTFFSAQRIDATVEADEWLELALGSHDVTITSNGQTATLSDAFTIIDTNGTAQAVPLAVPPARGGLSKGKAGKGPIEFKTPSGAVRSVPPGPAATAKPVADVAALKKDIAALQKSHNEISRQLEQVVQLIKAKSRKAKSD